MMSSLCFVLSLLAGRVNHGFEESLEVRVSNTVAVAHQLALTEQFDWTRGGDNWNMANRLTVAGVQNSRHWLIAFQLIDVVCCDAAVNSNRCASGEGSSEGGRIGKKCYKIKCNKIKQSSWNSSGGMSASWLRPRYRSHDCDQADRTPALPPRHVAVGYLNIIQLYYLWLRNL